MQNLLFLTLDKPMQLPGKFKSRGLKCNCTHGSNASPHLQNPGEAEVKEAKEDGEDVEKESEKAL